MLDWLKRKQAPAKQPPAKLPGNPGEAFELDVPPIAGRPAGRINLVRLVGEVLVGHGHSIVVERSWLEHRDSGLVILPLLLDYRVDEDGRARSVTTIQVHHPVHFPQGLFEYQHSWGNTLEESLRQGIDQWAQLDLFSLLEAVSSEKQKSMRMELEFPEADGRPRRKRQIILGPVAHFMANPKKEPSPSASASNPPATADGDGDACPQEHDFCPCCLFTNSMESFMPLLEMDEFIGIRLFAVRLENGAPNADCRVNGEDFEPGAAALRTYVGKWPDNGYEFRKQYVALRTLPAEG